MIRTAVLTCALLFSALALASPAAAADAKCKSNENCDSGLYCEKPVGKCDGKGMCKARPENCTTQFDPVCGCDGKTYSNACNAAMAGVSVAKKGECDNGGGGGGGSCQSNEDCGANDFCNKPEGSCKKPGECAVRPEICTKELNPVCGCDDQTYSNPCLANRAGVSIQYKGECKK